MSEKLHPPGTPSRRDAEPGAPLSEDPALTTEPEPLGWGESREVVHTAWELQAEAEARADAERRTREMAEAAAEVGLDEAHLPLAEGLVRARVEERARRRVEARGRWKVAAVAGLLGALALGVWVVWPAPGPTAPFAPWTADLGGWTLETSAGTLATVTRAEEAGRGTVTAVSVERFVPLADGRYWANLESTGHDWTGARTVTFAVRGATPATEGDRSPGEGLETVRLYLETPDERWRGPPVPIGSAWQTHTLAIADFERQVRSGGGWRVVADAPPRGVETASFKLGWWVNDAGASGTVLLDDLRVE